jgi:pentapeptide MXKDX repeat protein
MAGRTSLEHAVITTSNPCCGRIVRSAGECPLQLSVTWIKRCGSRVTKPVLGSSWGERQEVALKIDPNKDDQPMTTRTRTGLGFSAALLSLSLALAPAAFAQDKMGKDDGMKKDSMSKDAMKKDDGMMKKDGMKKDDAMTKDGMKKDDGMKKN